MDFKESNTYKNLQHALDGELKASTKYEIYGFKAREEGFEQIGELFAETSHNEREHGELWMKLLNKGKIPNTLDNLKDAYTGETYEWTTMYREFAQEAHQEGYHDIAELFEGVADIERHHDFRFRELTKNIENRDVFCKKGEHLWICMNCGNVVRGRCAPEKCPVCEYPQAYYKLLDENY